MSIFCVGGPEGIIVPTAQINTAEEDRYFLPGIIHGGEDYIIQVWGWNAGSDEQGERIGAKYLFATDILDWAKEATGENGCLNEEIFAELINERAEEFVVENDGTGDFVTLNSVWDKALPWNYAEVIAWAEETVRGAQWYA